MLIDIHKFQALRIPGILSGLLILISVAGRGAALDPSPPLRPASAQDDSGRQASSLIEGFTEPYADINVAAAEMGTLSSVSVRDGDEVRAGQLIAQLDNSVLSASLEVARAGMQAEGELLSAKSQLKLKSVELQKFVELLSRNHASQQELDRVQGEVWLAEGRLKSVEEDLTIRRLEFARIQAQLKQREVRATIDGVIVEVKKDCGEFVSPSDAVVARIVQLDPLMVVFSVPSDRRSSLSRGDVVDMQIGQHPEVAQGQIEYVSPTADASSSTLKVKVRLPNPDRVWHSGEKSVLLLGSESLAAPSSKQLAKNQKG
jgi:RND family efflux transporter MFP subunit